MYLGGVFIRWDMVNFFIYLFMLMWISVFVELNISFVNFLVKWVLLIFVGFRNMNVLIGLLGFFRFIWFFWIVFISVVIVLFWLIILESRLFFIFNNFIFLVCVIFCIGMFDIMEMILVICLLFIVFWFFFRFFFYFFFRVLSWFVYFFFLLW